MDIVVWLRSLGLGQYEDAFRNNEIDETVLPGLTAEDLKELGVAALGHRRWWSAMRLTTYDARCADRVSVQLGPWQQSYRAKLAAIVRAFRSGVLRRAFSPTSRAGGMVFFIPWRVVAEESARRILASAARCCSTCSGRW